MDRHKPLSAFLATPGHTEMNKQFSLQGGFQFPAVFLPGYEVGGITRLMQRRKRRDWELEYLRGKAACRSRIRIWASSIYT